MKVYKVKVNNIVYEVEVEAVDEVKGSIETPAEPVKAEQPAKTTRKKRSKSTEKDSSPNPIPLLKKAPRLQVIQSEVIPVRTHDSIHDICAKFAELAEL